MGDVKLTPRQTAALLNTLDEGLKSVEDARHQVIEAMAERSADRPAPEADKRATRTTGKPRKR